MVHYGYFIRTERNDEGKPVHKYVGKRNVDVPGRLGSDERDVSPDDFMGKKVAELHEDLMRQNVHIAWLETRVEEWA